MSEHVVIIGSGLGGLACGAILAQSGLQVTVLEQNAQLGGCLQSFRRRGAVFETGMHFIGSAASGQTLDRLMRYLGIRNRVQLSQLDPSGYDVVSLAGQRYRFANGRRTFIDTLAEQFPQGRADLEDYFDLVEKVANVSSLHSFRYADTTQMVDPEFQLKSIDLVLEQTVSDPQLRHVLCGTLPLYAAQRGKTPFSVQAFIMDFYNQSAWRVVGGSSQIAEALADTIRRCGGRVKTNSKVEHIECDNRRATAVVTAGGARVACDRVISDTHPLRTLEMLGPTPLIRPAFRRRMEAIPQTVGGFVVYLKFRENTMPYMNHNFYGFRSNSPWDCENYTEADWPRGYLYMHMCDEPNQKWARSGEIISYMRWSDVARWSGTRVGCRGQDYEDFKRGRAERLIAEVEREMPGLRGAIEDYWTSTPLTYRDYTGTEQGGMYGVEKDVNNTAAYRVSHRLKVPGVLQTGQNINSHGMLGVLVGAVVTCSEIVGAATIYQQIMKANAD